MGNTVQEFFWTTRPDEHWFNGPHPSREAALQEGREQHPRAVIFTGILNRPHLAALMPDGGDIIEHMQNQAADFGDTDNEWLNYIQKADVEDLTSQIQVVIEAWLEANNEIPAFGTIEDEQSHLPAIAATGSGPEGRIRPEGFYSAALGGLGEGE